MVWALLLPFAAGLLVGLALWYGAYGYGLGKGRAEHAQCHQAQRALAHMAQGMAREADDIKAWEDEL